MNQKARAAIVRAGIRGVLATVLAVGALGTVWAQEEGHGGGAGKGAGKGAGGGGGGGHSGGGHEEGGSSGSSHGGEIPKHGTGAGHVGHASGVHSDAIGRINQTSGVKGYAVPRRFAGGAGIWGGEQVPEGIAAFGQGEGSTAPSRLRYWGGWNLYPEDDGTPAGGGGSAVGISALDGQARCEDVSPGVIESLSTRNWARLGEAIDLLQGPGQPLGSRAREMGIFTLAVYQFELLSERADVNAAATHLAAVSRVSLDEATIGKINWVLCIRSDRADKAGSLVALAREKQMSRQPSARR